MASFLKQGLWSLRRRWQWKYKVRLHVVADGGGVPMDFAFWIQHHKVSDTDTRMRLVLHIELNMMMKMMRCV